MTESALIVAEPASMRSALMRGGGWHVLGADSAGPPLADASARGGPPDFDLVLLDVGGDFDSLGFVAETERAAMPAESRRTSRRG